MSLLAQTISQIFEIEFCQILPFGLFFTLISDLNHLQIKFYDLILYWVHDRGPKSFGKIVSYIRVTYSKCVQGALKEEPVSTNLHSTHAFYRMPVFETTQTKPVLSKV